MAVFATFTLNIDSGPLIRTYAILTLTHNHNLTPNLTLNPNLNSGSLKQWPFGTVDL